MSKPQSAALIEALKKPQAYPHPCNDIKVFETHISWIILTGDYAYKIKKPVDLGFLDFTSLGKRKHFCEQELALNTRSAPDLYLGLVSITGTPEAAELDGSGEVIDYAVKMRQFDNTQLFPQLHQKGELNNSHMDELAIQIADFHQRLPAAPPKSNYGQPSQVIAPMQQNFDQMRDLLQKIGERNDSPRLQQLAQLEAWTHSSFGRLQPLLMNRKQQGMIRDCHGDMHMGNLTVYQGRVTLFDCIEFNEDFRWIDVISDVAFMVMDLEFHGLKHLANRFLNNYLEETGDYSGLQLMPFYKAYRAAVRAKITLFNIVSAHTSDDDKSQLLEDFDRYLDLAEQCSELPNRLVITMHGLSGTGKSTVALRLVDQLGVIRLRSDAERKRLFHFNAQAHPDASLTRKMYSDTATKETYDKLAELCRYVLDSGFSVIIDATNLKHWQRHHIQQVADERGVPLCIAYCQASMSVIREWITKRAREDQDVSDAGMDTVDYQIANQEALTPEEQGQTVVIHSDIEEETRQLVSNLKKRFF